MVRDRSRKGLCRRAPVRNGLRGPQEGGARKLRMPIEPDRLGGKPAPDQVLVDSISHHGVTATLEIDSHVTANPGFECNIPR
jgi:hypothetical protein